jgi:hypothetical protein
LAKIKDVLLYLASKLEVNMILYNPEVGGFDNKICNCSISKIQARQSSSCPAILLND